MQGIVLLGVFLRAAPFVAERRMERDALMDAVRESLTRYFGKAGERVVEENLICVQRGYDEVREVPPSVDAGGGDGGAPRDLSANACRT